MALTTTPSSINVPAEDTGSGFLARLGHRIVEARQARANQAVASYLLSLDDTTLTKLGYDRNKLERMDPRGYPFI